MNQAENMERCGLCGNLHSLGSFEYQDGQAVCHDCLDAIDEKQGNGDTNMKKGDVIVIGARPGMGKISQLLKSAIVEVADL